MKSWILTVKEDGVLTFPMALLDETGWREGDTLHWIDNKNGTWSIVKEEDLTNFIKKGTINNE